MGRTLMLGVLLAACAPCLPSALTALHASPPQSDLDAFMARVLAERDQNWKKLQQYVLDERDLFDVRGPGKALIWSDRRDYTWYIRDGFFVQSPTKANGVPVPEADRRKAEDDYLRRVRARERANAQAAQKSSSGTAEPARATPQDLDQIIAQTRQPGFVDSAYFLRFKFEQGTYALVGHEQFDGRDVLRIEYYPTRLFSHELTAQERRRNEGTSNPRKDEAAAMEQLMNKVALVTLWIEPASHQIVKYTFDNITFDFLPVPWLMKLDGLKATMTMSQPFPDVWLPRDLEMNFSAILALGQVDARYRVEYSNYLQGTTSGTFVVPAAK